MSTKTKNRSSITADTFCYQVSDLKNRAKNLTYKVYEGLDNINPFTIDSSCHLENGIYYTKARYSIIKAMGLLEIKQLMKVFSSEMIQLFKQEFVPEDCYGIIENHTRQILIDYVGQVFAGPVKMVVYTNNTFPSENSIEFLIEMYQTVGEKEKLSNRMLVVFGKSISMSVDVKSLKDFLFLERKIGYDLTNLSYNKKGTMTVAGILDNMQNRLGLAMEWVTGIFFYEMKERYKKGIIVRRANYSFSGIPIKEPWNKRGFIIDTYVKKNYEDDGIRLEFFQAIYREGVFQGRNILSLVGIGFREIIFMDRITKRPTRMKFASPQDIVKLQKQKKKEEELRLRVKESVEKALNMQPKKFWESIWPENWGKKKKKGSL